MREEINTHVGHSTPKPRDSCSASQSEPCFVMWEIDDRPSHPLVGSHRGHVTEPMVLALQTIQYIELYKLIGQVFGLALHPRPFHAGRRDIPAMRGAPY